MKYLFIAVLLSLAFYGQSQKTSAYCSKYKSVGDDSRLAIEDFRSDTVDIVHTKISLDFTDMTNQHIQGNTTLMISPKLGGVSNVKFDFEGLTVDSVVGTSIESFTTTDTTLSVHYASALTSGQSYSVMIHYHGTPKKDASGWGGFYFTNGYAYNLGVGFAADPHSYGRIWFPCFDNFIERSTFEFFITTPYDKVASCNGQMISETIHQDSTKTFYWKLDQPIPSYLACVTIGSYEQVNDTYDGVNGPVPIQLFGRASDTNNLKASFTHLQDAIAKYEESYGDYKFNKVGYSLVPFNSGAMEHATNITYPISAANGSLGSESLMAHELGHMWWGDNVTCETDGDMWINEGWASFSVYLFNEAVYGRKAYESAMLDDLAYMLRYGHHFEGGFRAVSGQSHEYVYGDHVYKKGALVAHNLRGYLGDDAFFSTIDKFMDEYQFQPVSSDTLERFFSLETGVDLSYFFRDWVFNPGYNVVILDSFSFENNSVKLHLKQKLRGTDEFHENVPVYYTMYDQNRNTITGKAVMTGEYDEIEVDASFEPVYVAINPNNELAQARTSDFRSITTTGSLSLKYMLWQVTANQLNDSAWVWFDQYWTYPDMVKDYDSKPYRLNDNRYWRVSGIDVEKAEMTAIILYDGRASGSTGYLDIPLLTQTEDSLVLLYRSSSADDWAEYEYYTKNVLGSSTNANGYVQLSKILSGEYVFANIDHSVLGISKGQYNQLARVYPNPVKDLITIWNEDGEIAFIRIFSIEGKIVSEGKITKGSAQYELNVDSSGVYLYELQDADHSVIEKGKIVLEK